MTPSQTRNTPASFADGATARYLTSANNQGLLSKLVGFWASSQFS